MIGLQPTRNVDRAAAQSSVIERRPEGAADAPFRYALFCASRPPGGDFAVLDARLRETLQRQQFAGQDATYRTRYPQAAFDIILCAGGPIGRIVIDRTDAALLLVDIALLPAWCGQGIGTRLLRALCDDARNAGLPLRLRVNRGNPHALRLYQRLGFVMIAQSAIDVQLEWSAAGGTGIGTSGLA